MLHDLRRPCRLQPTTAFKPTPLPEEVKIQTISLLTTKTIGVVATKTSLYYSLGKRSDVAFLKTDEPCNKNIKITKRQRVI